MDYNAEIIALIGDFYENHANQNYPGMKKNIQRLEFILEYPNVDSEPFRQYFSELYSGRGAIGSLPGAADYPVESIIRELFQNVFDSYYSERDIKLALNFKGGGLISIAYNELSFTLEQFLYFLGIGRGSNDTLREGRFGIGVKSVFMNTLGFSMRSNTFGFNLINKSGKLEIEYLNLKKPRFKGTEIQIVIDEKRYDEIYENLINLTEEHGKYINIVDLCFAFNRKKVLNPTAGRSENIDRTFNIAITENGEFKTVYQVLNYKNPSFDVNTIRFLHNGRSVVDFVCHEYDDIIFLIPFAISGKYKKRVIPVLSERYNFFSTYELTGLLGKQNEGFLAKKLSAFFISVPNVYVAVSRTGIRYENEQEVIEKVQKGIADLIASNKKFFLITLTESRRNPGSYYLRPESYLFEFVKRFILNSSIGENLHLEFLKSTSFSFPGEKIPVAYGDLAETAYLHETRGVLKKEHEDGSAYNKYILDELSRCEKALSDKAFKTVCVKYYWSDDGKSEGSESGEEFLYKFYRGDKTFIFSSVTHASKSDFDLCHFFKSMSESKLTEIAPDGEFADEVSLINYFNLLDHEHAGDYAVDMSEDRFIAVIQEKSFEFDLSSLKVHNLKKIMDVVESHKGLFMSYPAFLRLCGMLVDKFSDGGETIEILKALKKQGVNFEPEFGNKISFSAYGKKFTETRSLTLGELLFLCTDEKTVFTNGNIVGRKFDLTIENLPYSYDSEIISGLLKHSLLDEGEIARRLSAVYMSDLDLNLILFLDGSDNIEGVAPLSAEIDRGKKFYRYVILNTKCDKKETTDIIERIICGNSDGVLAVFYAHIQQVNRILPDQILHVFKPNLMLEKRELNELIMFMQKLKPFKEKPQYKNYFIKDLNYKFYGYGGSCQVCGCENGALGGFELKDFFTSAKKDGRDTVFNFSFLLCANDAALSNGWKIENLEIGGLNPFEWLSIIKVTEKIFPVMFSATFEYREQIAYGLSGVFSEKPPEKVLSTPKRSKKIRLTPLMAAKWIIDN
ncbi:MAG: hypothetical protein LBR74_10270 [Eubacterium sp.]|jgi:hypothetical protein|nr:hypothetical protein [Eubacterium sp.]